MKPRFHATSDLIGKYINRYGWSDITPVGKIIGIKGKTTVVIQPIEAGPNKTKMEFITGGFSAHAVNNDEQSYDYFEEGEPFEIRLSNSALANMHWSISDRPHKKYDFNF